MGRCSRCGREGETEYGADGMSYCSSCIFYGMNKQCFRCRMYLPSSELQQYRGQWVCPYCLMDMRSEDRRAEHHADEEHEHVEAMRLPETCDRCGRELGSTVYIWNHKRLCKRCMEDEQEKWGVVSGKPGGAGQIISLVPVKTAKKRSLLEAIIGDALALLRLRPKEKSVVVVVPRMPISAAKPMAETKLRRGEEKRVVPQVEGIMQKRGNVVRQKKESRKKQ